MTNNTAQRPTWTVLVYMVADTGDSFYQYAMKDITEMMNAQFDDRVRVIVHADAPSPWQTKCWEVTGAPTREEQASKRVIGQAKEIVCGHTSLLDFVEKCVRTYRSDYYLLVLWGHGEGIDWKQKVLAGRPPSSAIQGAGKRFAPGSQNAIEVGELGKALAGLDLRNLKRENIVVGFDACLMGMVEVYDEIWEYVGWGVAAADEIPDTGWPYTAVLQVLGDCPETKPKELADQIVSRCADWYSRYNPDAKISFAACDLLNSPAVLESMTNLTKALIACIDEIPVQEAVKKARDYAEDLQEKAYVDLYAFCSGLKQQIEGKAELQQLYGAVRNVISALTPFLSQWKFSDSYPYTYAEDARALSICFPESADLVGSISDIEVNWGSYRDLTFSKNTHWPDFLEKFWGRQPGEAPAKGVAEVGQRVEYDPAKTTAQFVRQVAAQVLQLVESDLSKTLIRVGRPNQEGDPSKGNAMSATNKG
jgi:Clostripain family